MRVSEYDRVFGGQPTPILPDETIVDIGSGYSDLSAVVPNGAIVQIDPIYSEAENTGNLVRLPLSIGEESKTMLEALSAVSRTHPSRVTMANVYRYLDPKSRITALEQMLFLAAGGMVQIYPFRSGRAEVITAAAEKLGADIIVQEAGRLGVRQALYSGVRTNSVLTVKSQPKKSGPADRKRLAKVLHQHL